jgi:hypothetical protein
MALILSVKRVTTLANRGASAEETHSMANLSGSMPESCKTI